jgi:DNA-binding response OmpR family regulator
MIVDDNANSRAVLRDVLGGEPYRRNAKTAAIPIVVLTGRTDHNTDGRVRHLGAENCLHKPLHVHDLLAELRRYIEVRPKQWNE